MRKDPDIPVMGVGDVDNAIQLVGLFQGKVFLLSLVLHLNYLSRDAATCIEASRHDMPPRYTRQKHFCTQININYTFSTR